MAFKKEHPIVQQFETMKKNGMADLDEITIHQMGEMIQDVAHTKAEANHICNPFGNLLALLANVTNMDRAIAEVDRKQILMLYVYLAAAPYQGKRMTCSLYTFSDRKDAVINQNYRRALKQLTFRKSATGMEKDASSILQLELDGEVIALYYPKWRCFLPGTKFAKDEYKTIEGQSCEKFLAQHPHIYERCRALLTDLIRHGADKMVLGAVLLELGGPLGEAEMQKFTAEERSVLPKAVEEYIRTTSPEASPETVCEQMGTRTDQKLLDAITLIHTEKEAMLQKSRMFGCVNDHLFAIPPVQNTKKIEKVRYSFGAIQEDGLPQWIEFTAELDSMMYHKIFVRPFEIKVCQPMHILDMANGVPDGILQKFNYLEEKSSAGNFGGEIPETEWKYYPEDPEETRVELKTKQDEDETWTICQRTARIERLELYERGGQVLGTIIPEAAPWFVQKPRTMYVAIDPAGSVSVRLQSLEGSGQFTSVKYQDLVHPLTPMARWEFEETVENYMVPADRSGTHFESLLQEFISVSTAMAWSPLMVESRIWTPDEEALFEALKHSQGTQGEAYGKFGVVSNMKELLTRTSVGVMNREAVVKAFKSYIGILIMESVLALSREGFRVSDNLEFLLSYPENGSGEGITQQMKEVILGAVALANEYLAPERQLLIGTNVHLYSEAEAAAVWNQANPPQGIYLGGNKVGVGTPDYGHSTHDFSLRANGKLYLFSVPYAAQKITNATIGKVYWKNTDWLLRCFQQGGTQKLKQDAREVFYRAFEDAGQNGTYKSPVDRLGFSLTLSRLFAECRFQVVGINSDSFQKKVQELTELKLNVAVPAYASVIKQALKEGNLKMNQEIILTPVGRGSLALTNTAPGFLKRFITRLQNEIAYLIEEDPELSEKTKFQGNIRILDNRDLDKTSIAKGLIEIREQGNQTAGLEGGDSQDENEQKQKKEQLMEHYLDLAYDGQENGEEKKEMFRREYTVLDNPSKRLDRSRKYRGLYEKAFDGLMGAYTYEKFQKAFIRFGYTDIQQGIPQDQIGLLDEQVSHLVSENFDNLCAELYENSRELIMSVPFVEEEMICGAMIDLVSEKLDLFPDTYNEVRA